MTSLKLQPISSTPLHRAAGSHDLHGLKKEKVSTEIVLFILFIFMFYFFLMGLAGELGKGQRHIFFFFHFHS